MIRNAIVIGGGIAGMASAAVLGRMGASVTVLEQAPKLTEIGAGLQVSPNGLCVLRALGLEPELVNRGALRANAVSLRDYRRSGEVARLDLKRLAPDQAYYFVHRADLLDALIGAAKRASADIRLNQSVVEVRKGEIPEVVLGNGDVLRAELVVGADGVHSVARSSLNPQSSAFFTKQVAWRAIVPNVVDQPNEARVYMGPGKHIVAYPLRGGAFVNLVAVEECDDWQDEGWRQNGDSDQLRETFAEFSGGAAPLLDAVKQTSKWGLFRHPVAARWFEQGIALVGDAAHPMLPFMAQGANMALEDAWVLGRALKAGDIRSYQSQRLKRVTKVVKTTQGNANRYHLRSGPIRLAAHLGLKTVSTVAPSLMLKPFDWLYRHNVIDKRN
ncbi:MAG: FAD-dependent monooxygenase [Ascidiaceihabitans sp.]|nr:FAD-dependent monooxygenase [Ascidiaceihabitans sp.]